MDEPLTEQYCREVIGTFTFGSRRLLAWDSFSCHLTPGVKELLNKGKVDPVIVPGGCTKYIQAPDVSWNKPMKEYLREKYDTWLAEEDHELTAQGNMRGPSRQQMIEWVLDAWRKLPEDIIKKLFKVCALSTSLDGAEDAEIMCIKHGPCQNLLQRLQASQLDSLWENWNDFVLSTISDCAPKCKRRFSRYPPWINGDLAKAIRKKKTLWKQTKRSDDMALKEKFRKERQRIKNWIRLERTLYFIDLANNAVAKPKKFWSFFSFKTRANRLPDTMMYQGISISDDTKKAESFNASSILFIQITLLVLHPMKLM